MDIATLRGTFAKAKTVRSSIRRKLDNGDSHTVQLLGRPEGRTLVDFAACAAKSGAKVTERYEDDGVPMNNVIPFLNGDTAKTHVLALGNSYVAPVADTTPPTTEDAEKLASEKLASDAKKSRKGDKASV